MTDYALGDRVLILGTVRKQRVGDLVDYPRDHRPWDYTGPWKYGDGKRIYDTGVIVGKRTMPIGHVSYGGADGASFRATKHVIVYLVAYRLTARHAMCLPDQIAPIPKEQP